MSDIPGRVIAPRPTLTLELIAAGFTHLVMSAHAHPGPRGAARWLAQEIIEPVTEQAAA